MALNINNFIYTLQGYLCLTTKYDSGCIQSLSTIWLSNLILPSVFSWIIIYYEDFLDLASAVL